MRETASPRIGQEISHYRIEARLGSGGMGEVFRATDLRLRRKVALKFLHPLSDPAMKERLMREAQAASLLDHPNICTIFEVDETPAGEVFIAMAYYEGETLDRILARGRLDTARALSIAIQVARGLAAAHEELIVHRDIKPGNLMIAADDTVKILDFGLAKLLRDAVDDGGVVGTPHYMSPEQLRGEPVDQRADIWALGAVLHEMATGARPFVAESVSGVIAAILSNDPVCVSRSRPGVPPRLARIIEKALAKSVRSRYGRIDEMAHGLAELQAEFDTDAITQSLPRATAHTSIAVLPFQDMSSTRDQEFLCDGIAEEILRSLSRIPDLHVASRTSAFQFKNRSADIREIGALLNVDTVLEGSVRRVDDRVRISVQLASVVDGYRLWNERYDREMKDIFAVEDEIAEQIAVALKVALRSPEQAAFSRGETPDAQAYEYYLQGRQFIHQHRRRAFENALHIFSQAIEINPDYARAYAGIADCHSCLRLYFGKGDEALAAADVASARALELDPNLPDAHASRGMVLLLRREFDRAEFHLRRAIEIAPLLFEPRYMSGRLCFSMGRVEEAAGHFAEAVGIVPEAYDAWYLLGMCYRRLGLPERARNASRACIEAVKRWVRVHPDDTRAWTMGASVLAEMGEPERSARWVERALTVDADEPIIEYNAACVYVRLGRFDDALRCLEVSLGQGGLSREWATNDPDLDALRGNPRFQALLDSNVS